MEDKGFSCQGGKTKHQVLSFLKHFRKPVFFFLCFLEIRAKFSICIQWESQFFPKHFVLSQNFCTFLGKPCFCSLFEHFEKYVICDFLIIFTNLVKGCLKSASQSPGKKGTTFEPGFWHHFPPTRSRHARWMSRARRRKQARFLGRKLRPLSGAGNRLL